MIRLRYQIEIKAGEKVDLLFSLALFSIAKRRRLALEITDNSDTQQRLDFFLKLIYCAAINAWEYRRIEAPELGDFPYTLLDFAEWGAADQDAFAEMITAASAAVTGKEPAEGNADKDLKKK